jgi:hypothetical protein
MHMCSFRPHMTIFSPNKKVIKKKNKEEEIWQPLHHAWGWPIHLHVIWRRFDHPEKLWGGRGGKPFFEFYFFIFFEFF